MDKLDLIKDVLIFGISIIIILLVIITMIMCKFNKLYNYFIVSEKSITARKGFSLLAKGLPPINAECPTKEELENLNDNP